MMKHTLLIIIGFILVSGFFSCKKDRGPRLIVHVQEKDGTPAIGATVRAWYSNDPPQGVHNQQYDQTTVSDGAGDATFDFKNSAVLDVDVIYYKTYLDTLLNSVTDTLYGHRVVKIEMVRQKSHENNYNETVIVE